MKRWMAAAATTAGLLVLAGCNTTNSQPSMRDAMVTPAQLQPGGSALLTVKISDRNNVVQRVEGVVKEYPQMVLPLYDDGTHGDVEADDNVWTLKVDVDFQAAAGQFTVEVKAYDGKGRVVVVRDPKTGDTPLIATAQVAITLGEVAMPPADSGTPPPPPPPPPAPPAEAAPAPPAGQAAPTS